MSLIKNLHRIATFATLSDRDLSEEQRVYWHAVQRDYLFNTAKHVTLYGTLILAVSVVAIYFIEPRPQAWPHAATHALIAGCMAFWHFQGNRRQIDIRHYFFAMIMVMAIGYAATLGVTFHYDSASINAAVYMAVMYVVVSMFGVVFCPYSDARVLIISAFYYAASLPSFWLHPTLKFMDWSVVFGLTLLFALGAFYGRAVRGRREALNELAARQLIIQNERLRTAALEKDLALAQEIQDSFAPPSALVSLLGLRASFYQLKHDTLGGDWMATRLLANGDLAVLVVDVTGKGVQAALVVHAVQSLWAHSLDNPVFDPEAWIRSVNRTLLQLGQRKDHTLSLGLVVMNPDTMLYYSAGHVPVFLVSGDADHQTVVPVLGRGNLLGMNADHRVHPLTVDLRALQGWSVLIGTDGVFDKGVRTKKKTVEALLRSLQEEGAQALAKCPAYDDKLLVWIELAA